MAGVSLKCLHGSLKLVTNSLSQEMQSRKSLILIFNPSGNITILLYWLHSVSHLLQLWKKRIDAILYFVLPLFVCFWPPELLHRGSDLGVSSFPYVAYGEKTRTEVRENEGRKRENQKSRGREVEYMTDIIQVKSWICRILNSKLLEFLNKVRWKLWDTTTIYIPTERKILLPIY